MNNKHLASILLFLFTLPAHSEIFKWVDEQGNTHFSDKPVDEQSSTQVSVAEPETRKPESNNSVQDQEDRDERRRRLADAMQEDRLKKKGEKEKVRAQQEEQNKQCIYAKDRLRRLEDSHYLYNLDKDGNRVIVSDEQRQTNIDKFRAEIKKHCGN